MDSAKHAKRVLKKQRKCQAVAEKETGVTCCSGVTKNLVICNAGLSNGLSEELLYENFSKFGPLESILMLPGKSCCFVSYRTSADAQIAYTNTNGLLPIAQDEKPIYLAYTEALPAQNAFNFNEKPNGLVVIENFITPEQEETLLGLNNFNNTSRNDFDTSKNDLKGTPRNEFNDTSTNVLNSSVNQKEMKHRQVKHYGYEFRYDINNVHKDSPLDAKIPEECGFLWTKLTQEGYNFQPDQLTVNCYKPGQGIPPHIDTHSAFEDPLLSLSLNSDCVMEFRHKNGAFLPVFLPKRSLVIMSGEARYDWSHGITPRKFDVVPTSNGLSVNRRNTRVSFTFRKVRVGECDCSYKGNCDSYKRANGEIAGDVAAKLEATHVHDVYENIAGHFSDTRHKPWPNVLSFVKDFDVGSVLVDVGCGNGKYLGSNRGVYDIGCDMSLGLLSVCKQRGFQVFNCNCLNIPLKDGVADGIISIAVIHHLANEPRRKQALNEMIRVMSVTGKALIYVWAKDQNKDDKSSYLMQDRKNRKQDSNIFIEKQTESVNIAEDVSLPVHSNRKQFEHQDLLVPWKLKRENKVENEFLRYYHVFEEGELEALCLCFDNIKVVRSYYDQGNWCVLFEKIK